MTELRQTFAVPRGDARALEAGRLAGCVVAIGNFDGVHRGHRSVIAAALARARALGRPAAALTFDPHPRTFFRPDLPLFRLSSERGKLRLLAAEGLSSPEIAGRLFLSNRTVSNHLQNIYGKLGVRGRSELTRALDGT